MINNDSWLQAYLYKNKLAKKSEDFTVVVNFLKGAMQEGLLNFELSENNSYLPMLPAFVTPVQGELAAEPIIVLDAGGTNLRLAKLRFLLEGESGFQIEEFVELPMPGLEKEVDKEGFLEVLFTNIKDWLSPEVKRIGFCFSYPAEIKKNGDGLILAFGKEVKIKGMQGELLLKSLCEYMTKKGVQPFTYGAVVNDTVSTLLSSVALANQKKYDLGIGFILGTGMNMAYFAPSSSIKKLDKSLQSANFKMAINTELGCLKVPFSGAIDEILDQHSQIPSDHCLEKMMAGRYLGEIFSYTLFDLLENSEEFNGVIDEKVRNSLRDKMQNQKFFTTVEVSTFLKEPHGTNKIAELFSDADIKRIVFEIAYTIVDRAAFLFVAAITAVAELASLGKDIMTPLAINIDGSTYYKTPFLAQKVEYYLEYYLKEQRGIHTRLLKVEQGNLVGAALAALSQNQEL